MTHGTVAPAGIRRRFVARQVALGALASMAAVLAPRAAAQAWHYPALHLPYTSVREYNFAVASGGDAGTSIFAQWREDIGLGLELNVEAGLADPKASGIDTRLFLGAGLAGMLWNATPELPLDILLAGGVYPSFGDPGTIIRIPIGVVAGRRFPLEGSVAVTPYVHPRVSLDFCRSCRDNSGVSIDIELGGDVEINQHFSMRLGLQLSGNTSITGIDDNTAFGISVAWKPTALAGGRPPSPSPTSTPP